MLIIVYGDLRKARHVKQQRTNANDQNGDERFVASGQVERFQWIANDKIAFGWLESGKKWKGRVGLAGLKNCKQLERVQVIKKSKSSKQTRYQAGDPNGASLTDVCEWVDYSNVTLKEIGHMLHGQRESGRCRSQLAGVRERHTGPIRVRIGLIGLLGHRFVWTPIDQRLGGSS